MTQPTIKLMADYGCWPLWWGGNHPPGNIDPATLGLAPELAQQLAAWASAFDATLNEDDPIASGFRDEAAFDAFERAGLRLWEALRRALAPTYVVVYQSARYPQVFTEPEQLRRIDARYRAAP